MVLGVCLSSCSEEVTEKPKKLQQWYLVETSKTQEKD